MWKYTVQIRIKKLEYDLYTIYTFRKDIWAPQLSGVTHLHLVELGYSVKIDTFNYNPTNKEFFLYLEDQAIDRCFFNESNFKDWSHVV